MSYFVIVIFASKTQLCYQAHFVFTKRFCLHFSNNVFLSWIKRRGREVSCLTSSCAWHLLSCTARLNPQSPIPHGSNCTLAGPDNFESPIHERTHDTNNIWGAYTRLSIMKRNRLKNGLKWINCLLLRTGPHDHRPNGNPSVFERRQFLQSWYALVLCVSF